MSLNPETLKLARKYLKRIKKFGEEDFLTLCVKENARVEAGLPIIRSVESVLGVEKPEPEKSEPKKCHKACKNFSAGQYGTGACELGENPSPVAPDHKGCKRWEKESTGDV